MIQRLDGEEEEEEEAAGQQADWTLFPLEEESNKGRADMKSLAQNHQNNWIFHTWTTIWWNILNYNFQINTFFGLEANSSLKTHKIGLFSIDAPKKTHTFLFYYSKSHTIYTD